MTVVDLAAFVIVPIALLGREKDDTTLPRWARWYDEPDYGINGDRYWPQYVGDVTSYWARLRWLLRNKAVYFSKNVLGIKLAPTNGGYILPPYKLLSATARTVPNDNLGIEGFIGYILYDNCENDITYSFYWVWKWPLMNRCIRMYVGYKFNELWERDKQSFNYVPFVFTFNPMTGFGK